MCNETNKSYLQTIHTGIHSISLTICYQIHYSMWDLSLTFKKVSVALVMLSQVYLGTISLTELGISF